MLPLSIAILVDREVVVPGTVRLKPGRGERYALAALRRLARAAAIKPYHGANDLAAWIERARPDLVFNMTEHAEGDRRMDGHITALLDLHGIPYTGPGPDGLMLCRDKAVSKMIAERAGFAVPRFFLAESPLPRSIPFPVVVKPRFGDGSEGMSQNSIVTNREALIERIGTLRRAGVRSIICEEYVGGREMLVCIAADRVMPLRELVIARANGPLIFSDRLKHDRNHRRRWGVRMEAAQLTRAQEKQIATIARRAASALALRDYGRLDVKLSPRGEWVFLEANPNPALVPCDRSFSGAWSGIAYDELLRRIIRSALRR